MEPLRTRVSIGLRWGVRYAAVYSIVGILGLIRTGSALQNQYHLGAVELVALYFGSGILGGVVFGLLMPLGSTLIGAAILGLLVGLPVFFLTTVIIFPTLSPASGKFLFVWLGESLWLGPAGGAALWIRRRERPGL